MSLKSEQLQLIVVVIVDHNVIEGSRALITRKPTPTFDIHQGQPFNAWRNHY